MRRNNGSLIDRMKRYKDLRTQSNGDLPSAFTAPSLAPSPSPLVNNKSKSVTRASSAHCSNAVASKSNSSVNLASSLDGELVGNRENRSSQNEGGRGQERGSDGRAGARDSGGDKGAAAVKGKAFSSPAVSQEDHTTVEESPVPSHPSMGEERGSASSKKGGRRVLTLKDVMNRPFDERLRDAINNVPIVPHGSSPTPPPSSKKRTLTLQDCLPSSPPPLPSPAPKPVRPITTSYLSTHTNDIGGGVTISGNNRQGQGQEEGKGRGTGTEDAVNIYDGGDRIPFSGSPRGKGQSDLAHHHLNHEEEEECVFHINAIYELLDLLSGDEYIQQKVLRQDGALSVLHQCNSLLQGLIYGGGGGDSGDAGYSTYNRNHSSAVGEGEGAKNTSSYNLPPPPAAAFIEEPRTASTGDPNRRSKLRNSMFGVVTGDDDEHDGGDGDDDDVYGRVVEEGRVTHRAEEEGSKKSSSLNKVRNLSTIGLSINTSSSLDRDRYGRYTDSGDFDPYHAAAGASLQSPPSILASPTLLASPSQGSPSPTKAKHGNYDAINDSPLPSRRSSLNDKINALLQRSATVETTSRGGDDREGELKRLQEALSTRRRGSMGV